MKTSTDIPKAPGIYRISIGPRTFYWGQAQDLRVRDMFHRSCLRRGVHHNSHLQASFDKHGDYTFEVSLLCPVEDLDMQEQFCLDIWWRTEGCANTAQCAYAPTRGLKHGKEFGEAITRRQTGELNHNYGKTTPKAVRAKMSEAKQVYRYSVCLTDGSVELFDNTRAIGARFGVARSTAGRWVLRDTPTRKNAGISNITRKAL